MAGRICEREIMVSASGSAMISASVVEEPAESFPAVERIADRVGELALAACAREAGLQDLVQSLPRRRYAPGVRRAARLARGGVSPARSRRAGRCGRALRSPPGARRRSRRSRAGHATSTRRAGPGPIDRAPRSRHNHQPEACRQDPSGARTVAPPCGRAHRQERQRADRSLPKAGRHEHTPIAARPWSARARDRALARWSRQQIAWGCASGWRVGDRAAGSATMLLGQPIRRASSGPG